MALPKKVMNFAYGMGAAVVIVGALFKIQHWTGASAMLIIGLGVEALIFGLSAFDLPAACCNRTDSLRPRRLRHEYYALPHNPALDARQLVNLG